MAGSSDITPVVLVVEDEWLIRLTIAEALIADGFQVIEAVHANEALAILASRAASIHILFTDIRMPGPMDGLALAHHTRQNCPWIALLVTSATPPEDTARPPGSRFLPKPYTPSLVLAQLRDLIAA